MTNKLLTQISKLLFLFIFIGIIPNVSYAAPNDCIQKGGDIACYNPNVKWTGSRGTVARSFEQAIPLSLEVWQTVLPAVTFTLKVDATPPTDLPCVNFPIDCSVVTTPDNGSFTGEIYVWVLFPDADHYIVFNESMNYSGTCLSYDTLVSASPEYYDNLCKPDVQPKNLGCPMCEHSLINSGIFSFGDPVNANSGNKYEVETDYIYNSSHTINFTRYYNNQNEAWTHTYQRSLAYSNTTSGEFVAIRKPNQNIMTFKKVSGNWAPATPDIIGTVTQSGSDWIYTNSENELETYNSAGVLKSITQSSGNVLTMSYDSNVQLSSVTDSFGNQLTINTSLTVSGCTNQPLVTFIVGVDGLSTYSYTYDSNCNITQVTYPDTTYKTYTYDYTGNLRTVVDENLDSYSNYNYYSYITGVGYRASVSGLGSLGSINQFNASYGTSSTTLTDGLGNITTIGNTSVNSTLKTTGNNKACTNCSGTQGSSVSYDTNGNPTTLIDFNSNTTTTTYTP